MLRPYLDDTKRCYNHPHRTVSTACARCRLPLCPECLYALDAAEDLYCERCRTELKELEAQKRWRERPWRERLRPSARDLQRAALITAVAVPILVLMLWLAQLLARTPLTAEELGRIAAAVAGGGRTSREGTNLLSSVLGGRFVRASHLSQTGFEPQRLIDNVWQGPFPDWRSAEAVFPQDLVFSMPDGPQRLNTVILRPHPDTAHDSWVREFELLASTGSPDGTGRSLGRWQLDQAQARASYDAKNPGAPQRFRVEDAEARYVILRVWSNHGHAGFVSLAELEAFWQLPPASAR